MAGRPEAYWVGALSGFCVAAGGVLLWFIYLLGPYASMYAEFRAPIPALTTIVISPAFLWSAPIAVLVATAIGNRISPERRAIVVLSVVAIAAVLLIASAYWFATSPIRELSSAIK